MRTITINPGQLARFRRGGKIAYVLSPPIRMRQPGNPEVVHRPQKVDKIIEGEEVIAPGLKLEEVFPAGVSDDQIRNFFAKKKLQTFRFFLDGIKVDSPHAELDVIEMTIFEKQPLNIVPGIREENGKKVATEEYGFLALVPNR